MNQPTNDFEKLQALNTVGTISYVLHLIVAVGALIPGGQVGPVLLIVALVIDMVKRSEAEGTWIAWILISIWFLYRIVKGMVNMNKGLAMEFPA